MIGTQKTNQMKNSMKMSDRPTPRTDAEERRAHGIPARMAAPTGALYVSGDFARDLERELAEARELALDLAARVEQILLCKSGPHGWVIGSLQSAAKQAESSMLKTKEILL